MPFSGELSGDLSANVLVEGKPAAVEGSSATNTPAHVPTGGSFMRPPSNRAQVQMGSKTVLINNKPAAHLGDPAITCSDPADAPNGSVIGTGTVLVGD